MNKKAKDTIEASLTLGQALKQHRQAKKMSVNDVAVALNLKEIVITDIEENLEKVIADIVYQSLYLRGYITNYAKVAGLVNLKDYPEYQQFNPSQKYTRAVSPQYIVIPPKKKNKMPASILFFILLVIIAVGAYFFISLFNHQPSEPVSDNAEMQISTTNSINSSTAESNIQGVLNNKQTVANEVSSEIVEDNIQKEIRNA